MKEEQCPELNWVYDAVCVSVYDADTIRLSIDTGFGDTRRGEDDKGMLVNLHGIDAYETRGEEKAKGDVARDALKALIEGKPVRIQTIQNPASSPRRYSVKVWYSRTTYINSWLVEQGHAKAI